MVLAWFRDDGDKTLPGAGFGISRATAYRYLAEGITVLSEQAADLHTALRQVADQGWSHVVVVGKLFTSDRLAEVTTQRQRRHHPRLVLGKTPPTSKPSCAQTGYRSGPVMPYQGICTT